MADSPSRLKPVNPFFTDDSKSPQRKAICTSRDGQCTHMTMTRIYTEDFRCAVCLQPGSMGWLYRCTQDRELLLEDDLERDILEPFDQIATMFLRSSLPKKRSPAARTSGNLAFLGEISQEDFESYSPAQVRTILMQRTQLLGVLKESKSGAVMLSTEDLRLNFPPERRLPLFSIFSKQPDIFGATSDKSWLPTQECQFKCCQRCRPTFHERCYLSLNAIINGELPATAVAGFGFHYQGERPVAMVEHVRNLGLRPSPPLRKKFYQTRRPWVFPLITSSPSRQDQPDLESAKSPSPFNDEPNADTTFGQLSNAYDSTAMTRSLNVESGLSSYGGGASYGANASKEFEDAMLLRQQRAKIEGGNECENETVPQKIAIRSPSTPPHGPKLERENLPLEGLSSEYEIPGSSGRSAQFPITDNGLRSSLNLDIFQDGDVGRFLPLDDTLLSKARVIPLPAKTVDEQASQTVPAIKANSDTAQRAMLGSFEKDASGLDPSL